MTRATGQVVLGIDFGTSNTVAALAVPGRSPRVLSLDGSNWLPSAVFLTDDSALAVGRDAERRARLAPDRFEGNPKRRIDDGQLLLGAAVVPVVDAIAAVLRRVSEEAQRQLAGRSPDLVVLTHPAQWGSTRRNVLVDAARKAGFGGRLTLLAEPVAAAVHFASLRDSDGPADDGGPALAVYDLGGGTVDCAVVTTDNHRYSVAADDGLTDVGGVDFDQALLDQLGRVVSSSAPGSWRKLLQPKTSADRRNARALHEDVRTAKESLSRYSHADVPLPEPFSDALISRAEFEGMIRPMVVRTIDVLAATIDRAGFTARQLRGIYLVGGSSRIPLVGKEIADRIGVVATTLDQPETAVALGAALWPAAQQDSRTSSPAGPLLGAAPGPTSKPQPGPQSRPHSAPVFGPQSSAGPALAYQQRQPAAGMGQSRPPSAGGQPPWGATNVGRPGMPPKRSSRSAVIAVAAAVVVLIAAGTTIVLANMGGSAANGPTSNQSTSSGPSAPSSQPVISTSGPVDPSKCAVDNPDQQGITNCLREFAGGLVNQADCTTDAKKLGMSQTDFDELSSLASVFRACFSPDKTYVALLFQTPNTTLRDATWTATLTLLDPRGCGNFLTTGPRGIYAVGPSTKEPGTPADGPPAVYWEDTALPLIGIFRPVAETSTLTPDALLKYFGLHSGLTLTPKTCEQILQSTGGSSSGQGSTGHSTPSSVSSINESTVLPDSPAKCNQVGELDEHHMTQCIAMIAGKTAEDSTMCFDGKSQLDSASSGIKPVAVTGCVLNSDEITKTVLFVQFASIADRDVSYANLSKGGTAGTWNQGSWAGTSASDVPKTGTAQVVWTVNDLPVLGYATAAPSPGTTLSDQQLRSGLQTFWKSTLLPQN